MIISVSLGNFYYWFDEFNIDAQLKSLELIKDLDLDGVELHFSDIDMLNEEFMKFKGKLDDYIVTVHLSVRKRLENVEKLASVIDVKYFIIHADQYVKFKLPKGIPFLVENSDKDKDFFKDIKDMIDLEHDLCLDINHLDQTRHDKFDEQVEIAKKKIKEVHVSCLENSLYDNLQTYHNLILGSEFKIPKCVPRDVIWVIEGVIPKDRIDLLKKEIEFLRLQ